MRIPGRRVSQAEGTGSTEAGVSSFGGSGVSMGQVTERIGHRCPTQRCKSSGVLQRCL